LKRWSKGILVLVLLAAASGCIPTQRQLRAEQDLEEMKRRLAKIERSMAVLREGGGGETEERLEALARQQADLQAGLDTMRVEFQSVNGRLEDMARERAQLRDDLSLTQDDLSLKVTALEDRVARLEEAKTREPAAPAVQETPEALYRQGLELIQKEGEFARGREVMSDFLARFPDHPLAANAMYWIGEAFYGDKKYENAILQFQDVIQKHGDHPKAAAALLKQGLAFKALDDIKNARVILQKVVTDYPGTSEAKKAEAHLAEWGKGG